MTNTFHLQQALEEKLNEIYPLKNTDGWLSTLCLHLDMTEKKLTVTFPHAFFQTWFAQEVQSYFEKALYEVIFSHYAITPYIVYENSAQQHNTSSFLNQNIIRQNIDYFDEFIYNTKNEFPLALIREMAHRPFLAKYNPFVMYGSTSTGKTQILQCLRNALCQDHALKQALFYGTLQDFALQLQDFGAKILCQKYLFFIIDKFEDVSPIMHQQNACVEFLEICQQNKKQVIFASTISPENEKLLQKSLQARLHTGLIVQLKNSDIDVRMRFAVKYGKELGTKLSKEHILLLAQRCKNISMVRGVMLKIKAFQSHYHGVFQNSDLENILHPFDNEDKNLTPQGIVSCIATYFEMNEEQILGERREPNIVRARQVSMYLCRDLLGLSYPSIGKFFGGRDHSTVMYAFKKIKKLTDTNKNMQHMVTEIKAKCLSL